MQGQIAGASAVQKVARNAGQKDEERLACCRQPGTVLEQGCERVLYTVADLLLCPLAVGLTWVLTTCTATPIFTTRLNRALIAEGPDRQDSLTQQCCDTNEKRAWYMCQALCKPGCRI